MKIIVPDYYRAFRCIAGECRHTCCEGWEIDIDPESLARFSGDANITRHIEYTGTPHFHLASGERCPFLNKDKLCDLILQHGEGVLCQICRDHPRFKNFWTDRTEIGLGLVCEEAARIILSQKGPMLLNVLSDDGVQVQPSEDEVWLLELRDQLLDKITERGPRARLLEYLIYRHLPDALYDNRIEERIAFINASFCEITDAWANTDGSLGAIVECVRAWSYDVEYDEDELERRISGIF